jgi:hypothetical protein
MEVSGTSYMRFGSGWFHICREIDIRGTEPTSTEVITANKPNIV